jgi:hypothetical protein
VDRHWVFDLEQINGEIMGMEWRKRPIRERLQRRTEVDDDSIDVHLRNDITDALDEIRRLEGIIADKGPSGFEKPFTESRSGMGIPKH